VEVAPGVHQLKVPIPGNSLGYLNAYLVKTSEGSLLIDTGWNTEESYSALVRQLDEAGQTVADLRYIAITHVHPDHYGLVGRLAEQTHAHLIIHEIERSFLDSRYVHYDRLLAEMDHWLRINGVPESGRPAMQRASLEILGLVSVAMPDMVVRGGEHLKLGEFEFEILLTPGHSPGHLCFYDAGKKLLFSGDHVLPNITPNVSLNVQAEGNPLRDYLVALDRVAHLPVDLVLPAHGEVFRDLGKRVTEIEEHHARRTREMLAAFAEEPRTAFQIASAIKWSSDGKNWENLPPLHRRMAMTETLAHLEMLFAQGGLDKTELDGMIWYSPKKV
jgi:glyoxylase-like metal-dependent hydrolase (beta-lactamase superfamily II)